MPVVDDGVAFKDNHSLTKNFVHDNADFLAEILCE